VPLEIFLKESNIMPCPLQAIDVLEIFLGRKQCPLQASKQLMPLKVLLGNSNAHCKQANKQASKQ
jgi:hypothetical protein